MNLSGSLCAGARDRLANRSSDVFHLVSYRLHLGLQEFRLNAENIARSFCLRQTLSEFKLAIMFLCAYSANLLVCSELAQGANDKFRCQNRR